MEFQAVGYSYLTRLYSTKKKSFRGLYNLESTEIVKDYDVLVFFIVTPFDFYTIEYANIQIPKVDFDNCLENTKKFIDNYSKCVDMLNDNFYRLVNYYKLIMDEDIFISKYKGKLSISIKIKIK